MSTLDTLFLKTVSVPLKCTITHLMTIANNFPLQSVNEMTDLLLNYALKFPVDAVLPAAAEAAGALHLLNSICQGNMRVSCIIFLLILILCLLYYYYCLCMPVNDYCNNFVKLVVR